MSIPLRIPKDELSRDPAKVLRAVRRGDTVMVEDEGEARAAIVDPVDLQILQAVISYYVNRPRIDPGEGLPEGRLAGLSGAALYEAVLAYYLSETISLGRAAEALETSWLTLRDRFARLNLPLRSAPIDEQGARQDILVAESTLF